MKILKSRPIKIQKNSANYIESNQIGLKSVQQMIKIHDGTFTVIEESTFCNYTFNAIINCIMLL